VSPAREVKLGAVFTQHGVDDEARPIHDHESTTYVASYAPAADFSLLLGGGSSPGGGFGHPSGLPERWGGLG
jgi:hypothetical protein